MSTRPGVRKPSVRDSRKFSCTDAFELNPNSPKPKPAKRVEIKFKGRDATPQPFPEFMESAFSIDDIPFLRPGADFSSFPIDDCLREKITSNNGDIRLTESQWRSNHSANEESHAYMKVVELSESPAIILLSITGSILKENYLPNSTDGDRGGHVTKGTQTFYKSKQSAFVRAVAPTTKDSSCNPKGLVSSAPVIDDGSKFVNDTVALILKQQEFLLDVSESTRMKFHSQTENPTDTLGITLANVNNHSQLLSKLRMMKHAVQQSYSTD